VIPVVKHDEVAISTNLPKQQWLISDRFDDPAVPRDQATAEVATSSGKITAKLDHDPVNHAIRQRTEHLCA
jgi:hypothetical protein